MGDYVKYLGYIYSVLNHYFKSENKVYNIIMAVVYTGDGKTSDKRADSDVVFGNVKVRLTHVSLASFDTNKLYSDLKRKIESGENLSDEDIMRFIVLPITESRKSERQNIIEKTIDLAKNIPDERQQMFVISGILVSTNNFIEKEYSNRIKEWISLTKVGRLYEEERVDAVNKAVNEITKKIARNLLINGDDRIKVMECTGLTKEEVIRIQIELNLPDVI
jgi:predicted transposase/invertase (TIGR01784 family)